MTPDFHGRHRSNLGRHPHPDPGNVRSARRGLREAPRAASNQRGDVPEDRRRGPVTPLPDVAGDEEPTPRAAARLGALMSHASVGIIEFDLEGRGVYVNRQWRELTGVDTPAPIPGEVMLGVLHPEDRPAVMEQWQRAVSAGGSYEATARVLHRDGQVHTIQSRTEPLFDDGEITGFVASIVDISRSLRNDQLARGDRYQAVHEQGSIGQVLIGLDTRMIDVNEAFAEMLGARPADLVGRPT